MDWNDQAVLVIDLDGTLIKTDLLLETGLLFVREQMQESWKPLQWLLQGKTVLKEELASRTRLDVATLPYNADVLELIQAARDAGRKVVLATASHYSLAEQVAAHLGLFDEVIASDRGRNLSATRKRDELVRRYGEQGFDYVGNSRDDLAVWRSARRCILVDTPDAVARTARKETSVEREIISGDSVGKALLKALRPHQWAKNALLLVPLLTAHLFMDTSAWLSALLGVCWFSMLASSAYLLNDLLDIQDDRKHPSKCRRPFASGALPVWYGAIGAPGLALVGCLGALLTLPPGFLVVLLTYFVLTLAYSFYLKRLVSVDVITLALLYSIRVVAGAFAVGVPLTFWILTFSMFIFLSLALMKRYTELFDARQKGDEQKTAGRGYYPSDIEMVSSMGVATGYLSILVLALYINDTATASLYREPRFLWLVCPILLFWITRIWMLTHRGQMHSDPVIFAIRDRVSLISLVLIGLFFGVAL